MGGTLLNNHRKLNVDRKTSKRQRTAKTAEQHRGRGNVDRSLALTKACPRDQGACIVTASNRWLQDVQRLAIGANADKAVDPGKIVR